MSGPTAPPQPAPDAVRGRPAARLAPCRQAWPLALILVVAGLLRCSSLGQSPPGLNQDEAANAWNAYCLLETGADQAGVRWPLFYTRCLGENRSTLFIYLLIPFQALGGLGVWTTRAPAALGGVLAVALIGAVGRRLFDRPTGLLAAALLTLNPWHIQQSRWGHEAALCPLLVLLPVALLLWADLPLGDAGDRRPRVGLAAVAGLVAGICCYGYPAVRLFLPVFLGLAVLTTLPGWRGCLSTRRGAAALAALALGAALTLGPLVHAHLTDPDINRRLATTSVWGEGDPAPVKLGKALARYPGHFGPGFLFLHGDRYPIQSIPGFGTFHWYMLPLMLAGAGIVVLRARSSRAARVLLAWVVAYPAGDLIGQGWGGTMHALRSLPGLPGLVLLGAVGGVGLGRWLWRHSRPAAALAAGLAVVLVAAINLRFLVYLFGDYNREPAIYHGFQVDLVRACDWLRPRLDEVDAAFFTTARLNSPYVVTLVALRHDPREWFAEVREVRQLGDWDVYTRVGRLHFVYGDSARPALGELAGNGRADRVVLLARPGELPLTGPAVEIRGPAGTTPLWIFEEEL